MTRCYCHNEIRAGQQRVVTLRMRVEWPDGRGVHEKDVAFCSFKCVADWANDRAAQWDGPLADPEPKPEEAPVVDRKTKRAVR